MSSTAPVAREHHVHTTTPTSLSTTQRKMLANAVLPALRRGPTRVMQGGNPPRFTTHGAGRTPKTGPGPLTLHKRYLAITEAIPDLDLPALALDLDELVMDDAQDLCYWHEWRDLWTTVRDTRIGKLYYLKHHPTTGTYASRNQDAGSACTAALTIVNLASIHDRITLQPE